MENNTYLTDEELEQLITQVEQQSMLQAPSYLKAEILSTLSQQEEKQHTRSRKRKQLWLYSAKVSIGAAAALVMLAILPANLTNSPVYTQVQTQQAQELWASWEAQPLSQEEWEARLKENEPKLSAVSNFLQTLDQTAGRVCQGLSETTNLFLR